MRRLIERVMAGSADKCSAAARLRRAPENFLSQEDISSVANGRRDFLRGSFLAAASTMVAGRALAEDAQKAGDEAILKLPPWSTSLGLPVAANPYGMPSKHESGLVRRQSPGLTQTGGSTVSFMPRQGMFGLMT